MEIKPAWFTCIEKVAWEQNPAAKKVNEEKPLLCSQRQWAEASVIDRMVSEGKQIVEGASAVVST